MERFTADEFRAAFGFVNRVLVSGLPPSTRAEYGLSSAERLHLPFASNGFLWRFAFDKLDLGSTGNGADAVTPSVLLFEAGGVFVLVDSTDRCFAGAVVAMRDLNVSSPPVRDAYLATYFAVSRSRRLRQFFHRSFRGRSVPDGADPAEWDKAIANAEAFAASLEQPDLYMYIDRQEGEVVVFTPGYRSLSNFGQVVPGELQKQVILQSPRLIAKPDPTQVLVRPTAHELLTPSSAERGARRSARARAAIREYTTWRPVGFDSDVAPVTDNARRLLNERRERFPWTALLATADGKSTCEPGEELSEFLGVVNARCVDYSIPSAVLEACSGRAPAAAAADLDLAVQRRSLPFYPSHRLYKVIDRRGGRPRQTQFLFAPGALPVPEGVDRLIPLNGTGPPCHMLNQAYAVRLTDFDAVEYLDFFCDTVGGKDGVFHVMETADDVRWRGSSPEQRALVATIATPIRLWPTTDEQAVVLDALLTYAGILFHAEFRVMRDGRVEMSSDRGIIDRLEIAPDLFSTRTHFFLRPPADFVAPGAYLDFALRQ